LGLATAGLTVGLKDFIVGFIGWFVLMGKNGIRLGDWVEINGVTGEVVEIGPFHTVLLETGNWTDSGHPTGRRVTFTNSFAIEGHYFNFSTTGQWLWDELTVGGVEMSVRYITRAHERYALRAKLNQAAVRLLGGPEEGWPATQ
jgi:small-conductance mechanosensitive channel